ncbi:related to N-terminal acetyltransferase A complex subunit NAT1 [Saccharomycodes ludwigii]|uniref:Related to N-terminal acetyltransferase A complex subunit NAT1 n=1 Tax=Saccharomycodes ludwigii TaxID=36035 RepID=A0A376B479_9ASCO|nr:related to N-terminal acetyltransferase A complex subunit NAT1 [Saccharomycodes ludwigii]
MSAATRRKINALKKNSAANGTNNGTTTANKLTISPKENTQFLEALKLYEDKKYNKSIKILETLLKKNASFVDALALKCLNLYFQGDKDQAESYCKKALKKINDFNASPICCHILGLYYRNVQDNQSAIKWFQAAMNNGSNNKSIYRDLAVLQSQERDFKGLLESRSLYWQSAMGYRANWTALAIAQDFNKNYKEAVTLLENFEDMARGKLTKAEYYEHNECVMYKNDLMFKAAAAASNTTEGLKKVLANLDAIENEVFDKYALLERKATCLMKLGELKEASKVYRALIKRNPDNFTYYKLLEVSLGCSNDNDLKIRLYEKLSKFYPRSEPPKYIPLTFIEDENLLYETLKEYILPQLKRGVLATFSNIKPLYKSRGTIIPKLVFKIVQDEIYPQLNANEEPETYIWTNYFLAQHYLFLKEFANAQECINKAIEHTPTAIELYIVKGRILKHLGLLDEAAEVVESARKLDLSDRYINNKTVKYYLRANNIDEAVEKVSLFGKMDANEPNSLKDLHLLEASWFIVEQAESYYRLYLLTRKRLVEELKSEATDASLVLRLKYDLVKYKGLSLKRFLAIAKIYKQFELDQLDFHTYCMRKGTARAYMDMIKWTEKIYTLPMYVRAMNGASKIYLDLDENARDKERFELTEMMEFIGSASGSGKNKKKKNNNNKGSMDPSLIKLKREDVLKLIAYDKDNDIFGEKLVSSGTPILDFETNFFNKYFKHQDNNKETCDYSLDFSVHLLKNELALCMGDINQLQRTNTSNDTVSSIIGSTSLLLLQAAKDNENENKIGQTVALKGLSNIGFAVEDEEIKKLSGDGTDCINYLKDKFGITLKSLLFLYQHHKSQLFIPQNILKSYILDYSKDLDPMAKNNILQYELAI